MEDKKFAAYQELRSKIINALQEAKYTEEDIAEFCEMLNEDLPEEGWGDSPKGA